MSPKKDSKIHFVLRLLRESFCSFGGLTSPIVHLCRCPICHTYILPTICVFFPQEIHAVDIPTCPQLYESLEEETLTMAYLRNQFLELHKVSMIPMGCTRIFFSWHGKTLRSWNCWLLKHMCIYIIYIYIMMVHGHHCIAQINYFFREAWSFWMPCQVGCTQDF